MDSKQSVLDFEILGYKIKLRQNEAGSKISPEEIVDHVREQANMLLNKMPHLGQGEAALLIALSMAQEKLELQKDLRDDVDQLHTFAGDALQFIEEVSPTTV